MQSAELNAQCTMHNAQWSEDVLFPFLKVLRGFRGTFSKVPLTFLRSSVPPFPYPINGTPKRATMRAYMTGMERTHRVCEIIVMLAPVSGLPP